MLYLSILGDFKALKKVIVLNHWILEAGGGGGLVTLVCLPLQRRSNVKASNSFEAQRVFYSEPYYPQIWNKTPQNTIKLSNNDGQEVVKTKPNAGQEAVQTKPNVEEIRVKQQNVQTQETNILLLTIILKIQSMIFLYLINIL